MISFETTPNELRLIAQIADRAEQIAERSGLRLRRQTIMMDLEAAHANGCPMNFEGLVSADRFDFTHDVFGIIRQIDRNTGKLLGGFSPRYALAEGVTRGA